MTELRLGQTTPFGGIQMTMDGMERARLRKLWREHSDASEQWHAAWRATGYAYQPPISVPFPDELRGLTCGARTRAGTHCKRRDLYRSGRCLLHGGASTGPKRQTSALDEPTP